MTKDQVLFTIVVNVCYCLFWAENLWWKHVVMHP